MYTLLLKLLIIQMTVQFTLVTALEGQTSHNVDILDIPSTNDNEKRITCPVYAIRPANQTIKFQKYTVSEEQFNKTDNWTLKGEAQTFEQCASLAASQSYMMFLFDENECHVSNFLYTRRAESCGDDSATVVYMAEPPEGSCFDDNQVIHSSLPPVLGTVCGSIDLSSGNLTPLQCANGILFTRVYEITCVKVGDYCFIHTQLKEVGKDAEQSNACARRGDISCEPKDSESAGAYIQALRSLYDVVQVNFKVNLGYDSTTMNWQWRTGGVVHPTDASGEWSTLLTDYTSNPYAYITAEGLTNNKQDMDFEYTCCM